MEFSQELKEKAIACKTAEELMTLAKANDIELSAEEAEFLLQAFAESELSDTELDNVAGGQEGCSSPEKHENVYWDKEEDVQFIFKEGDIVEASAFLSSRFTATCKVVSLKTEHFAEGWVDRYWLEKEPGSHSPFIKGWHCRNLIQK